MDDAFRKHIEELEGDDGISQADVMAHSIDAHLQATLLYAKMAEAFKAAQQLFPPLDDMESVEAGISMIGDALRSGCHCLCVLVYLTSNVLFKDFVQDGHILISESLHAEMGKHSEMDEQQTRAYFAERLGVDIPPENGTTV